MIAAARAPRRPVHIVTGNGRVACGAHRRDLVALTADNADAPLLVTCPACKRMVQPRCGAWPVASI